MYLYSRDMYFRRTKKRDTYSYGDIISESKTASTDVEFDVSGLVVNATDITLSDDKLIF